MKIRRKTAMKIAGVILAVMTFVQVNIAGLDLDAATKSWVVFVSGAAIAGLTTFKLDDGDTVSLEQFNRVVEASSIAETARLEAEEELKNVHG